MLNTEYTHALTFRALSPLYYLAMLKKSMEMVDSARLISFLCAQLMQLLRVPALSYIYYATLLKLYIEDLNSAYLLISTVSKVCTALYC